MNDLHYPDFNSSNEPIPVPKTKGILLAAWGREGYIYAAYDFAFSIKHFNRMLPVTLYCDPALLKKLSDDQRMVFDDIIPIDISLLSSYTAEPAKIKISVYEHLPYDNTLFLDVDALALQDLEPCIDEMIAAGGYFYSHILNTHTIDQGDSIPDMVWCNANKIWEKYGLSKDAVLPCTNSSLQFIRKCDDSKKLFELVKKYLYDPIPLHELKDQWGAAQPDELYLNIAMAQMGITGKTEKPYLFMGNRLSPDPFHKIQAEFAILSIFGGKGFTKLRYTEWFDKLIVQYHRAHGKSNYFKYQYILRDKHANTRPIRFDGNLSRFEVLKQTHRRTQFKEGKSGEVIYLYSSWFKSKDEERQKEIDFCLLQNLNNPELARVFVVCEDDCPIEHEKIEVIKVASRPTYNTFFARINERADEDTISIIANGDIYFDAENIKKLRGIDYTDRALALSRWEMDVNYHPRLFNYEWSQDVWIMRGKTKDVSCNHFLGVMQCDGRVAHELKQAGYQVYNPSLDIQSYHLHKTGKRTYDVHAQLDGEKMPVKPTTADAILKKKLALVQPGKVGDIIICAPIAAYYSAEYFVDWVCPSKYHSMFDSLPYAKPVEAFNEKEYDRVIDLSFGLGGKPEKWWQQNKVRFDSFVDAKYELAGLPVQEKNNFKWKRNKDNEKKLFSAFILGDDFALVHTGSDYGTSITPETTLNKIQFRPINNLTIFDWYPLIKMAKEIHCIDSSLCNFVDAIPEVKAELFYYKTDRVPQKYDETRLTKNWKRINVLNKEVA